MGAGLCVSRHAEDVCIVCATCMSTHVYIPHPRYHPHPTPTIPVSPGPMLAVRPSSGEPTDRPRTLRLVQG